MRLYLTLAMLIPVASMVMGMRTNKFVWHALLTFSCACIVGAAGILARGTAIIPLLAGLAISLVGDYFMCHKKDRQWMYILGIAFFLIAHVCFIVYSVPRFVGEVRIWVCAAALLLALGWYMQKRVLPNIDSMPMRIAVAVYCAVSLISLISAAGMDGNRYEAILYAFGIFMIVSSDCMIAECDFVHSPTWQHYIRPLYALCHILVTASAIAGIV